MQSATKLLLQTASAKRSYFVKNANKEYVLLIVGLDVIYPYLGASVDYASDSYLAYHYLLEIEICNCGAGNAIDVEFEMNGRSLAPIFCVTTDLSKKFICILNEDLLENNEYEMSLSYKYGDISSSAKYVQKEKVVFYRDNSKALSTKQYKSDCLTRPFEITDEK